MTIRQGILRLCCGVSVFLVLFPPLHWLAGSGQLFLGVPRALAYLFGSGVLVTATVVGAWLTGNAEDNE